jgi:hypothetical protein
VASTPEAGAVFYELITRDYELWLQPGQKEAKAEFTLPFNLPDGIRTVKYTVESTDARLAVRAKWPQTRTKPAQEGILYTLPVAFTVK